MISSVNSNAQDINIEKSNFTYSKGSEAINLSDIVDNKDGSKLYVYTSSLYTHYYFKLFDSNGNLIKETKYSDDERHCIKTSFTYNNTIYIFNTTYDKSSQLNTLYINTANTTDLKFTSKKLMTFKADHNFNDDISFYHRVSDDYAIQILLTEDRSAFSVYLNFQNDKKYTFHKLSVFDTQTLEILNEHQFPKEEDAFYKYRTLVVKKEDNSAYLLSEFSMANTSIYSPAQFSKCEIHKLKNGELKKKELTNEQFTPKQVAMVEKKGKLSVAGFYAKRNDKKLTFEQNAIGTCYYDIDPETLAITNSKFNPFKSSFYIEKFGKEKKEGFIEYGCAIKCVYLAPNNDVFITTQNKDISEFGDITAFRINDNGETVWVKNIPLAQVFLRNKALSYALLPTGNELYFFLNAEVKESGKGKIKFENHGTSDANLTVIKLDDTGALTHKTLVKRKESEYTFFPVFGVNSKKDNALYLEGRDDNKKEMLKITL